MRYLLLIYTAASYYAGLSEAERRADMGKWWEFDGAIKGSCAATSGEAGWRLAPPTPRRPNAKRSIAASAAKAERQPWARGASNRYARELGWAPHWASWRNGFASIVE